ncbi:MAG TPA: bifunctional diaminohydroxyphosphoribosylaminopyrimidine deaminase/5-amino-6-(5-phosphoribosylamino)uracil reductase RibD [Candidatus Polarisedimenticolaceae bacterium]|nr:bifunctional diaminohydroxyphosphoribosylaminopyrimidine deaminase/5-amino-6-(5-phosphoribosylamino)uracil reductase RibD [Candidatus Polarisedimenticolaceae bacterium]
MTDRALMAQTLALAALGEGRTRPNPLVGCVVVRDGVVTGRGFHRAAGEAHAEASALDEAGETARGATLYVNLEPCAHQGRTPPCVDAIVRAGIARVVAAVRDPNPLVDGRGFDALRQAGIEVTVGVLADEARAQNAAFFSTHQRRRPWVTLKAAQSWDGRIAAAEGRSAWVSGEAARRFAHRLRFAHDAVLVGAGTLRRDDPRLTVRLPGPSAPRLRVVLAPTLSVDPGARVFVREPDGPRTRVYADAACASSDAPALSAVADVVRVPGGPAGLDLPSVVEDLHAAGVQSVLVEGGGKTAGAFLRAGLVDEVVLVVAPRIIGASGATPVIDLPAAPSPDHAWSLEPIRWFPLGRDTVLVGRAREASCSPA